MAMKNIQIKQTTETKYFLFTKFNPDFIEITLNKGVSEIAYHHSKPLFPW